MYTIQQYKAMANRFNAMSFSEKIRTIRDNPTMMQLANDGNWWGVKLTDTEAQEMIEEAEIYFEIESEWGSSEMQDLIALLGITNTCDL